MRDRNGIRMSFLLRDQAGTATPERRRGSFPLILLSLGLLLPEPILRNPAQRVCIIFHALQSHALDRLGKISNNLSPRILAAGLFSGTVSKVLLKDTNYELLLLIRTKKYFIHYMQNYSDSRDKCSYGVQLLYRQAWRDGLADSF